MSEDFEPNIVAFLCNWCSYAGADLAGTSRIHYPANIKVIRGDCHYMEGNYYARRRLGIFKDLLEFVGVDPRRFHMSWVSASEGHKWKEVVEKTVEDVRAAGPFEGFRRRQIDW